MTGTTRAALAAYVLSIAIGPGNAAAQAEEGRAADRGGRADEEDAVVTYDATKGRDLDEGQMMLIRVSNSVQPAQSVIVSIIASTRPEYVLGAVPAGETREWKIDTRLYVGGVRFLAAGAGGRTIVNGIRAVGSTRARWNLGLNFMRYERLESKGDAIDR